MEVAACWIMTGSSASRQRWIQPCHGMSCTQVSKRQHWWVGRRSEAYSAPWAGVLTIQRSDVPWATYKAHHHVRDT